MPLLFSILFIPSTFYTFVITLLTSIMLYITNAYINI